MVIYFCLNLQELCAMAASAIYDGDDTDGFTEVVMAAALKILSPVTHNIMSALLDSHKVLLSSVGLHRFVIYREID